jgi:hypothetical protein
MHTHRLLWSTWQSQPLPEPVALRVLASRVQFTHWFIIGGVASSECLAIREAAESMLANNTIDTILWLENRVPASMHTIEESRCVESFDFVSDTDTIYNCSSMHV